MATDVSSERNPIPAGTVRISPPGKWEPVNFREIWEYRELLLFFLWRDIVVRYKETVLGFAWAFASPIFTVIIYTIIFSVIAKVPSDGIQYPLFIFTAIVVWTLFSESVVRSANNMRGNVHIIKKVYLPRLILPLAGALTPIVDFLIAFVILVFVMLIYGHIPGIRILLLPVFLVIALTTALGVGLWMSALSNRYRDIQYAMPFLLQVWFYASPVIYPSSIVPAAYQWLYGLNPMAGVIEGFRWAILGTNPPNLIIVIAFVEAIVLLITGMYYFKRTESIFDDEA